MDSLDPQTNRDKIFKGQQENEEYICFFRHHWIDTLKEFIYFGIFVFVVVVTIKNVEFIKELLRGNREMKLFFLTGFILGSIFLHRFFLKILNYFTNIGIITNARIIDHHKTLFFTDNLDAIDMAQIQNIEKKQEGLFPNILNFGDIKIFLNASDAIKTFRRVPNAKFHFRCLSRQKEERQRLLFRQKGTFINEDSHLIETSQIHQSTNTES
jgi:hypothetical protein